MYCYFRVHGVHWSPRAVVQACGGLRKAFGFISLLPPSDGF